MTAGLRLAKDLVLPVDAVTQTFLIVGKRGSGKSNTAARFVEQLHASKIPFVVLDPVDTWWGLKAGRDGGPGLAGVYVFGGRHADLPLESGDRSGALIAEVLCEHRMPMVLSVKHLSGRERSTFMVAFAQTLFQKWAGGPLHVVLEEAHELAPQSVQQAREGEQQMLGAFKRLWKLGRASGIGGTAVTQRPASLSKDITTQSEILVAHRTIGPQDVKAIGEWIKYHGERNDILAELPTLPTGEAFVWGPEFPSEKPIGLKRVKVLLRDTYDSASTPKVGEHRVEPKELAPADLERLRTKMAGTIERAKAEDPKELQKQVRELQRQLAAKAPAIDEAEVARRVAAALAVEAQRADSPQRALPDLAHASADEIVKLGRSVAVGIERLSNLTRDLEHLPALFDHAIEHLDAVATAVPVRTDPSLPAARSRPVERHRPIQPAPRADGISGPQQRMLDALARLRRVRIDPSPRNIVAALSNQSPRSSGWDKNCSTLRTAGLIRYPNGDTMALTDAGAAAADGGRDVLTLADLHAAIRDLVSGPQWRMCESLIRVYPDSMSRGAVAGESHQSASSSGWDKNCSTLRSLGLIDYPSATELVATELLVPRGLR